jgi:hypothetical protein
MRLDELISASHITLDESFQLSKSCSLLLSSGKSIDEDEGRRIIINVLDNWEKIPVQTQNIWASLIEAVGFYPYLDLEKRRNIICSDTAGKIRKEYHKSEFTGKYLHDIQKNHLDILMDGKKNLIVSAPTSFGKSLLIEEIVASEKYHNIVVIQPTLALLDETRRKLAKYKDRYKIIVRTTQEPSLTKGNLFLLTAERVMEYPFFSKVDFFIIDEFYKLSPKMDRERFDVLNNAFHKLVTKYKAKFYLLGPNIDKIPPGFENAYGAMFEKTTYALVDIQEVDKTSPEFGDKGIEQSAKINALYNQLFTLRDKQTIIYCSSPERVRKFARGFCAFLENEEKSKNLTLKKGKELPLVQWIKDNIGERWGLIKWLQYGIGIHDAALQKHITSSIIQYFNNDITDKDKPLNFLFCTSTIIEGVNTSAKNVIYFDHKKGLNTEINYFDYNNIKGRAGRMMIHYAGNVYNFNEPPKKTEVAIEIPFFDQKHVTEEILINLPESQIRDKDSEMYRNLHDLPPDEYRLFQKNGISIEGQRLILEYLKRNYRTDYKYLGWSYPPTRSQLTYVLTLAWNLLRPRESKGGVKDGYVLASVTKKFIKYQNIMEVLQNSYKYFLKQKESGNPKYKDLTDDEIFDDTVRKTFQIQRHWFNYKVPKWLNVMNSLQKYTYEVYAKDEGLKPGNYSYLSNVLENEFAPKNLAVLIEYGVPFSAIRKLGKLIPDDIEEEDKVLQLIKSQNLIDKAELIPYERSKVLENL